MCKELIISIVIVVVIFSFDYVLQKYTDESIGDMTQELSSIKTEIRKDDKNETEIQDRVNRLYDKCIEYNEKLSYYIEHNELEKVETDFIACKSLIESKEYNVAVEELEKTTYVLKHINEKYSFSLENIF